MRHTMGFDSHSTRRSAATTQSNKSGPS